MRPNLALLLTVLLIVGGFSTATAQTFGFTTEPLVPVGKFAKVIDVGWGATGYVGFKLGGRKSPWFFEANVAAQWLAGDSNDLTDFGRPLIDPGDQIRISGWLFPIRASLTRIFGRAYFSPRAGIFIPAGDLTSKLNMSTDFGITPKIGYFFFITRDLTADLGIEYTVIFDREPLMYIGFSFGFLYGGKRLPRRRIPY